MIAVLYVKTSLLNLLRGFCLLIRPWSIQNNSSIIDRNIEFVPSYIFLPLHLKPRVEGALRSCSYRSSPQKQWVAPSKTGSQVPDTQTHRRFPRLTKTLGEIDENGWCNTSTVCGRGRPEKSRLNFLLIQRDGNWESGLVDWKKKSMAFLVTLFFGS